MANVTIEKQQEIRRARLTKLMDEHGIEPNDDYDYSRLFEITQDGGPCGRFVAIYQDESHEMFSVCEGLGLACDLLAGQLSEEYLNDPVGVYDLDHEKFIHIAVETRVVALNA